MINHAMQRIRKLEDRIDQLEELVKQLSQDRAEAPGVSRETPPGKRPRKKARVLPPGG